MDNNCNNRSFSLIVDHPIFCLMAISMLCSCVVQSVRIIMEPINTAVERKTKPSK